MKFCKNDVQLKLFERQSKIFGGQLPLIPLAAPLIQGRSQKRSRRAQPQLEMLEPHLENFITQFLPTTRSSALEDASPKVTFTTALSSARPTFLIVRLWMSPDLMTYLNEIIATL